MKHAITSNNYRGAVGGKTGKTAVLPGFCKIEHGAGSGRVIGVLPGLGSVLYFRFNTCFKTACVAVI